MTAFFCYVPKILSITLLPLSLILRLLAAYILINFSKINSTLSLQCLKSLSRSLHLFHSFSGIYVALRFSTNHQQLTQNLIFQTSFVFLLPLSSSKVLIAAYKPAILLQISGEISHKVQGIYHATNVFENQAMVLNVYSQ